MDALFLFPRRTSLAKPYLLLFLGVFVNFSCSTNHLERALTAIGPRTPPGLRMAGFFGSAVRRTWKSWKDAPWRSPGKLRGYRRQCFTSRSRRNRLRSVRAGENLTGRAFSGGAVALFIAGEHEISAGFTSERRFNWLSSHFLESILLYRESPRYPIEWLPEKEGNSPFDLLCLN